MIKHIENLREKPLHVRKLILYTSVPTLTFLIAMLWFYSLGVKPTESQVASVEAVAPKQIFIEDTNQVFDGSSTKTFGEKIKEIFTK